MKKITLRLTATLLATIMMLGAAACGPNESDETTSSAPSTTSTTTQDDPETEDPETDEPETEEPETDEPSDSEDSTPDEPSDESTEEPTEPAPQADLPFVPEPVTYHFLGMQMNNTRPSNLDETDLMLQLAEDTNIYIEWELVPQTSWSERKNLTLVGRDYPDAFYGPKSLTHEEITQYGGDGVLIDLTALLEEHAPNINKIREQYTSYDPFITSADGKIYSLAAFSDSGFDSHISTIINVEWLNNLDLEMPTTTDEFYDVLKAFKDNDADGDGDPNNEIPFSFLFQEGDDLNREVKRDFRPIYYAFGVIDTPSYISITDNDEVIFTAATDQWKNATDYLHKLYSEGLVDQEVFTQDRTLLTNKLRTQQNVGAYTDYRKDYSMLAERELEEKYDFVPALISPDGDQTWARSDDYSEGAFAITNKAENPELLIKWINYYHDPELSVQMAMGMFKPEGYTETEALVPDPENPGLYHVNERPEGIEASDWYMSAPIAQGCTMVTKEAADTYVSEKPSSTAKTVACEVYRPHLSKYAYNYAFKFTLEEVEELALLQQDITSHVIRTQATWITSGGIEDEWDNFIEQLNNIGLERYLGLYEEAFARQQN